MPETSVTGTSGAAASRRSKAPPDKLAEASIDCGGTRATKIEGPTAAVIDRIVARQLTGINLVGLGISPDTQSARAIVIKPNGHMVRLPLTPLEDSFDGFVRVRQAASMGNGLRLVQLDAHSNAEAIAKDLLEKSSFFGEAEADDDKSFLDPVSSPVFRLSAGTPLAGPGVVYGQHQVSEDKTHFGRVPTCFEGGRLFFLDAKVAVEVKEDRLILVRGRQIMESLQYPKRERPSWNPEKECLKMSAPVRGVSHGITMEGETCIRVLFTSSFEQLVQCTPKPKILGEPSAAPTIGGYVAGFGDHDILDAIFYAVILPRRPSRRSPTS